MPFTATDEQITRIPLLDRQIATLPKEIIFCKRCVVSNQRPRLAINEEGICSACCFAERKHQQEKAIDWGARQKELQELCDKYRRNDGRYDVIVPCSGGKDSSYVAHYLKTQMKMHPLTVTWSPFEYTPIGWENYRNFIKAGFTNLLCSPNGNFHRKLSRIAFETLGDAWQPFTYGQMCYAFHIAAAFDVNLVFFGENGEAEYGGSTSANNLRGMPLKDWQLLYFKGAMVDELIRVGLEHSDYFNFTKDDFTEADLQFYRPPSEKTLKDKDIQMHWLGMYRKWVPQENYYYCAKHTGFKANPDGRSEGTYSKYASLDDQMDGFHYFLAFMKFGICRCTSDAAHEIRDGHITRDEGVALVKRFDGEFPRKYFKEFLNYLDITEEHFWKVCDRFRNPNVWTKENGEWKLRKQVE